MKRHLTIDSRHSTFVTRLALLVAPTPRPTRRSALPLVTLFCVTFAAAKASADFYVAKDGDDANSGLTRAEAKATIGAGYYCLTNDAAATVGARLVLGDGEWLLPAPLVLSNGWSVTSEHGAAATTLKPATATTLFAMASADSSLSGFTVDFCDREYKSVVSALVAENSAGTVADCAIRNYRSGWGNHLVKISGKGREITFRNCRFENCFVTYRSALFWAVGGKMHFDKCSFVDCSARSPTGVPYFNYGMVYLKSGGTLRNCSFLRCKAFGTYPEAAIHSSVISIGKGTGAVVENCTFARCSVGGGSRGGALACATAANAGDLAGTARNCLAFACANDFGPAGLMHGFAYSHCAQETELAGEGNVVVNDANTTWRNVREGRFAPLSGPAVDGGVALPWMAGETDLLGTGRVAGSAPDIGCYEKSLTGPATYYVAKDGNDANPGTTRALAKATIAAGYALLSGYDETLVVGDGVWTDDPGRTLVLSNGWTVVSENGASSTTLRNSMPICFFRLATPGTEVRGFSVAFGQMDAGAFLGGLTNSPRATLRPSARIAFDAIIPNGQNLTLSLGRSPEKFTLAARGNEYQWQYTGTKGETPNVRAMPNATRQHVKSSTWWEKRDYTPNGRYRRSFATPPAIAAFSEAMLAERWQTADRRVLRIAVELADGWLSFFVDDILFHSLPATADVAGRELRISASKGVTLGEEEYEPVAPAPGYWRVPLGRVATLPGNPLDSGNGPVELGQPGGLRAPRFPALAEHGSAISTGVPFLPAEKSLEVWRSWTREASTREAGEPHRGTFGGRWAGALSATPCRLQFRVPNRRYEAAYLLASCASNNFLTVQFYRPGSGFPIDCVPAEPIATNGALQVIRVPLRQDLLATFGDREILEMELTSRVCNYRAHPEPLNYSRHGMGEPSGVVVHAITLKENPLEIDFKPEVFANVWVGNPAAPAYLLTLRNRLAADVEARIALETRSYDGGETTKLTRVMSVPGRGEASMRIETPVTKYGWHSVSLDVNGESYERTFVVIRNREYKARPFEAKGFMFGGWKSESYDACYLAFLMGLESFSHGGACQRTDIEPLAKKYGARDFTLTSLNLKRPNVYLVTNLEERLVATALRESEVSDPSFDCLFAEPGGIGREASITALCGEDFAPRSEAEQKKFDDFKKNLIRVSDIFHRVYPGKNLLVPWGSPLFTVAFLQDPETRNLFEGMGYDTAFFDRLPEGQLHSCSLYVLSLMNREWRRYRDDKPVIVTLEGPCVSREAPESLTPEENLRNHLRCCLILTANGVTRLFASIIYGPEGTSYWAEQHYSGGAFSRVTYNPHRVYAAEATMVRLLRDCEFVRVVPTGSLGVFALEYRNVKTGKPLHALWCIRGKVPFEATFEQAFDVMDNVTDSREITPDPIFLVGCTGEITFGKQLFDPADATPAPDAVDLGSLADWTQSTNAPEAEYLANMPGNIVRHPVAMKVERAGDRLSVCLPDGLPDKGPMPFCTTLVPPKPVVLPGRPRILALDVETEADWGRVAYVLRDAKGEKFVSVGRVRTYNVDDTKCDSYFNFSGRRLVRFELPGNRPWDKSRLPGSCWWGAYGGDDCVDYPLTIEKVFIERRAKAMHVNDEVSIAPTPALLGHLYVEKVDPDSDLVMPLPPDDLPLQNPIAEIKGTLEPTEITDVTHPTWQYDGRRGHFAFREMPDAKEYDVYVSLHESGEGATLLKTVKASGELVSGFLPETDNYAFIVWRDRKGAVSRPSAPFKFLLHDEFAEK